MSLFSTPADLTAAITRRICSEFAASAFPAVDPWVWTPIVNAAWSGTKVMVPTPVTVMARRPLRAAGGLGSADAREGDDRRAHGDENEYA